MDIKVTDRHREIANNAVVVRDGVLWLRDPSLAVDEDIRIRRMIDDPADRAERARGRGQPRARPGRSADGRVEHAGGQDSGYWEGDEVVPSAVSGRAGAGRGAGRDGSGGQR